MNTLFIIRCQIKGWLEEIQIHIYSVNIFLYPTACAAWLPKGVIAQLKPILRLKVEEFRVKNEGLCIFG